MISIFVYLCIMLCGPVLSIQAAGFRDQSGDFHLSCNPICNCRAMFKLADVGLAEYWGSDRRAYRDGHLDKLILHGRISSSALLDADKLQHLRLLCITDAVFHHFPSVITTLCNLTCLTIAGSNFLLPDTFEDMHSLKRIDFSNNNLQEIPPSIGGLEAITSINLRNKRAQADIQGECLL